MVGVVCQLVLLYINNSFCQRDDNYAGDRGNIPSQRS